MTRFLLYVLALCLLGLLLSSCASAPKVGPCAPVNACGVQCCNNDGKMCPACRKGEDE